MSILEVQLAMKLQPRDVDRVERRILQGENVVTGLSASGGIATVLVPGWRQKPLDRLRIEYARWVYRRNR